MPIVPYPASYATRYPLGVKRCTACSVDKPLDFFPQHPNGLVRSHCRDCKNAEAQEYKKRNAEKVSAAAKEYYRANREAVAERVTRCRQSKIEHYNAVAANYKATHRTPERQSEENRRQYHKDLEKSRFSVIRRTHERRVVIRTERSSYTRQEWEAQKASQDYRCLMCGKREPEIKLTVDHIVPVSKGGMNTIDNLQGLCKPCNSRKKVKVLDLRR